jgi:hypothetical protein
MSPALTQAFLAVFAGLICLYATARMARRRRFTLRYAAGWSLLGTCSILFAALTPFLEDIATFMRLSPAGLVLVVFAALILTILFMVSVSVVRLQRDIQDIAETLALHRSKLEGQQD